MNVLVFTKGTRAVSSVVALGFACFVYPSFAADPVDANVPTESVVTPVEAVSDFAKYDANGDGKLSSKETAGDKTLSSKFKAADINSDGALSIEEYDNFKRAVVRK